jgi:hypothetical protein
LPARHRLRSKRIHVIQIAAVANKRAALASQQSVIDSARATVRVDEANEQFAEQDNDRYVTTGYGSIQNAQQAAARIASARAAVARDKAVLETATRTVRSQNLKRRGYSVMPILFNPRAPSIALF